MPEQTTNSGPRKASTTSDLGSLSASDRQRALIKAMDMFVAKNDYLFITGILREGTVDQLEELAELVDGFPHGENDLIHGRWITEAIFNGSLNSIQWMLSKGVDLGFCELDGYTPLHSALERSGSDKYEVLELLLKHGAPVNAHGNNDWTPAHKAVGRNDLRALKILASHGADFTIRTRIDNYETPLEMARQMVRRGKNPRIAKYLESPT
jgi:hypothetical protein